MMIERVSWWLAATLLLSGLLHLGLFFFTSGSWLGAVSLRKPALFGISAGVTAMSLLWLAAKYRPRRLEIRIASLCAVSLFIEVALITMQYWRGVPSHFNRASVVDRFVESSMLGLIVAATLGIFWLTFRVLRSNYSNRSMTLAIQQGMIFLCVSCVLGFVTTAVGYINLSRGDSYESVGQAGVLKFPHGVTLHAIQTLPILVWLLERVHSRRVHLALMSAVASHWSLLLYASWQTIQGRGRTDFDFIGGVFIGLMIATGLPAVWELLSGAGRRLVGSFSQR